MFATWRARAAMTFGLGVLALIGVLAFVLHAAAVRLLIADQSVTLATLARSTALTLATGLDERLREVMLFVEEAPRDEAGWRRKIDRLQGLHEHVSWVGLVGADGRVRQASRGMLQGVDVSARPWFQAALQGPHVGDVHAAKLLAGLLPPSPRGEPLRFIDFAAPIRNPDGSLQGVLGVHADWAWAQQVTERMHNDSRRERGVLVWIFDRDGELIHRPVGAGGPDGAPGSRRPLSLAGLDDGAAHRRVWDDGVEYLVAAHRLPATQAAADLRWTVVTRQPMAEALAGARQLRDMTLAAGVVVALLAALGTWVLAGRFSRPLERLTAAARAVERGALDTPIPRLQGAVELAALSDAVHGMTASLREREHELERRVEQRTHELRAAQAELQRQARHDALTDLHNRRAGDERLRQEVARHRRHGQPLALVLADIDHFKAVNDRHGHAAGDEVLRHVAGVLRRAARASDLVVRQGGEEFLVLLPQTDAAGARAAAEKLREAVQARPGRVPVTLSLGVAADVQAFDRVEAALEAADRALYAAKHGGRNRVVVVAGQAEMAADPAALA